MNSSSIQHPIAENQLVEMTILPYQFEAAVNVGIQSGRDKDRSMWPVTQRIQHTTNLPNTGRISAIRASCAEK
jgi:hypothetical protein